MRLSRHVATGFALLALACSSVSCLAAKKSACRICGLELSKGMERKAVERKVAEAKATESQYSSYGNNLQGGVVDYQDHGWILRVTYASGTPAYWYAPPGGPNEHRPPTDETVLETQVITIPAKQ